VRISESLALGLLVVGAFLALDSGSELIVRARENAAIRSPQEIEVAEGTPPEVVFAKAWALVQSGASQEALRLYQTLPERGDIRFQARVHYNLGTIYLGEAAHLWNDRGVLEYGRVSALVGMAKDHLREALRRVPEDRDARYNLEYAFRITPPPKEPEKSNWQGTKTSVFSTLPGIPAGGP
jgi:mxaK protein